MRPGRGLLKKRCVINNASKTPARNNTNQHAEQIPGVASSRFGCPPPSFYLESEVASISVEMVPSESWVLLSLFIFCDGVDEHLNDNENEGVLLRLKQIG